MKSKIKYTIIIFVNLLVMLLIYFVNKENIEDSNDDFLIDTKHSQSSQINSIGGIIDGEIILIDKNKLKYNFNNEIFGKDAKLCFRFYKSNCKACIDSQLIDLKKLSSKIGQEKVVIICDYDEEDFKWLCNKFNFKFKSYRLCSQNYSLGLNIEEHKIPYYFILKNLETIFVLPVTEKTNILAENLYSEIVDLL